MKLHELKAVEGSTKARKRIGHGPGSGTGKTSGKGEKGQNARSGGGVRPGFEGGQLPLFRRLSKRGFNNYEFRTVYSTVNVSDLNRFEDGTVVDLALLKEVGLIKKELDDWGFHLRRDEIYKYPFNKFKLDILEKARANM